MLPRQELGPGRPALTSARGSGPGSGLHEVLALACLLARRRRWRHVRWAESVLAHELGWPDPIARPATTGASDMWASRRTRQAEDDELLEPPSAQLQERARSRESQDAREGEGAAPRRGPPRR